MVSEFRFGVDWDNDAFIVFNAVPGDPPNLMDVPVNLSANTLNTTGTGGSQSEQSITEEFGNEAIDWVSGTSVNGALLVGSNADPIATVAASTAYTLSFWIRSESVSYDAVPLRVRVQDNSGATLLTSSNFAVLAANGWMKVVFNFTTGANTGVKFILDKNTSATNASYDISGIMVLLATYRGFFNWVIAASGAGATYTLEDIAFGRDIGDEAIDFVTGATVNAGIQVGSTAAVIATGIVSGASYTLSVWIKSESASYDAVALEIEIINQAGTSQIVSDTFTVAAADGWVNRTVTFVAGIGTTGIYFILRKDNSATSVSMDLAGVQVLDDDGLEVTTSMLPPFNAGVISTYDNITAYVKEASWLNGNDRAYETLGSINRLEIILDNTSLIFSLENSSSPITGARSNRKVEIYGFGPTSTDWERMYRGYILLLSPTPVLAKKEAMLVATSSARYFQGKHIRIALQVSVTAATVLSAIENEIDLPAGVAVSFVHDSGTATWPYVGDNWEDGVDAFDALRWVVESERGWLYWSRGDSLGFLNRTFRFDADTVVSSISATFTDDVADMLYEYGQDVFTEIEVKRYPRAASASTTLLLWTLNETIALAIGESYTYFVRFTDDANKTIGAVPATVANGTLTISGAGVTTTLTPKSNGCLINYNNTSGATRNVTAHTLVGQRITAKNASTRNVEDATAVATYGRITKRLDLPLVAGKADATAIADLELARHKDPRGRVHWIKLVPNDADNEQHMITRVAGEKIRIVDTNLGHDAKYIIVGERHSLKLGTAVHEVVFYLEPAWNLI